MRTFLLSVQALPARTLRGVKRGLGGLDTPRHHLRTFVPVNRHSGDPHPRLVIEASARTERQPPLLSIGLAVFNGAEHLRESIDSLLAQDVGDLELVISDNASTDETPAICAEYASRDPRVAYTRNSQNIGAAANFNRVFALSSGRYFMWGSDDDIWEPSFARKCIGQLDVAPRAVGCTSQIAFIREDGSAKTEWTYESIDTSGLPVEQRVHELVKRTGWFAVYSVIRPSALRSTSLFPPTYGADVRLVLELLLLGDMLAVPETLLHIRVPETLKEAHQYVDELDPSRVDHQVQPEVLEPYTYLARELLAVVNESGLDGETVRRIEDDFVRTLGRENLDWGGRILAERGLSVRSSRWASARERAIRAAVGL